MIALSLEQVARACGGVLVGGDPAAPVLGVVADSRDAHPGALFVAISGERVDGHDFAAAAVGAGAVAVLGARALAVPTIVVDDPVTALGRLATHTLARLPEMTVVAITGSSGKTSTKDLIAQVVDPPVVSPMGSYNTEVGLPLTVLRVDESTRVLVLEMGMRGLGHIRTLCRIARPDISVVTNVGTAHLELLGTRENIALAKGEIVEELDPEGIAILNADDPRVAAMARRTRGRVVTYGTGSDADIRAEGVVLDEQARPGFTLSHGSRSAWVSLPMHGVHMVSNALAAAAVGLVTGVDLHDVTRRLAQAVPRSRWRMEVSERSDGTVIVNDAYNANPESMRAGLEALAAMAGGRTTWAVLGEMKEIGPQSGSEHEAIGAYAQRLGIARIIAVGAGAEAIAIGARAAGHTEAIAVDSVDEALAELAAGVRPGDVVLVKASRSVGLEAVAARLLEGTG